MLNENLPIISNDKTFRSKIVIVRYIQSYTSIMKEMKDIAANNIERAKFLVMNSRDFKKSDHEAIDQERKRYSRVLSQRRGIASRVRGIRASLRNTKT